MDIPYGLIDISLLLSYNTLRKTINLIWLGLSIFSYLVLFFS